VDETINQYGTAYSVSCCGHYAMPMDVVPTADIWQCRICKKVLRVKQNNKREGVMPEISEYKGNKLLCLNPNDKFTFSFGLSKAKMILENLDAIKTFVESRGRRRYVS